MVTVKINGVTRTYPREATWVDVVQDIQPQMEDDILLVRVNGRLTELCSRPFTMWPGLKTWTR